MCGRSALTKTEKELEDRFGAKFYSDELDKYNPMPNYNVSPSHVLPVITSEDLSYFRAMRWGLIPSWATNKKVGYNLINARIETLLEKNSFKDAVSKQRCLVPVSGFYEWKKIHNGKQPYYITTSDQDGFLMAGLWSTWTDCDSGEQLKTFTIITQAANRFMEEIHDRMPIILSPTQATLWMEKDISPIQRLKSLTPYPSEALTRHPVSDKVGAVKYNDPSLIEEVAAKGEQGTLF